MQSSIAAFSTLAPEAPRTAALACAHCGTAVPDGTTPDSDGRAFCCSGCRAVYGAIHAAGLDAFYGARDGTLRPARSTARRYTELDGAVPHRENPDGTWSAALYVEGIHCAACVWLLESLPRVVPGLLHARLDFGRALLHLRWAPAQTTLGAVARQIDRFGYTPHVPRADTAEPRGADRALLVRLGVAGAIAGNVMLLALALYSGAGAGPDAAYAALFRWGSFALAIPSVVYCAMPFYRGAWSSLRTRVPNMDLPIALGVIIGFVSGAMNTVRGRGEIYFDTITVLIFLLLVGRWLTARQHRRAATAADFAQALAPSVARLVEGAERREVRAETVPVGALVEVLAGERIPVDGRIEQGRSAVDVRLLTGESGASDVQVGDRVYAGTENVAAPIQVRVEQSGEGTRVGQLLLAMERAQRERAPIVRAADRIAGYFVASVLALAAVTVALWWRVDPSLAVDHAVALLVVTCPCALGMATPLAVSVALARAARRGILLKNGEVLEALARPADLLFDKSGTLTSGRPELVVWQGPAELGVRASAAERGCDHPLARAFQRAFPAPAELTSDAVERFNGGGVRARVAGRDLLVGNAGLLAAAGIPIPDEMQQALREHAARGLTPVLVAEDGVVRALAAFGDALRPDAAASLSTLAALGYPITVLSGDHPLVVERVCSALPVQAWRGGVSPEEKLDEVRRRTQAGRAVIMIGDGMNDAAAMSAATVGFAVHGGAEASLLAAGGFATEPGVRPIVETIQGARETLRVIYRGIGFSLAYNLVGVGLAVSGVLSPLLAAILMPVSSVTVVTSALRSRAFQGRASSREEVP